MAHGIPTQPHIQNIFRQSVPPYLRGAFANGPAGDGIFQLAAGRFTPTQFTMEIASPRPDSERINSRYSFALPGVEFEAPIAVLAGAYPYRYEIISRSGSASNISAATIGESRQYGVGREWYGTADQKGFGKLSWTPDIGDDGLTYSFTVRVTGQDGVFQTVTFSGVVSLGKFIAVQDGVTSGTGTLESPFEDNSDWWGVDGTDATHAGKLVYYRAGNYEAFPSSTINNNKPHAFIGFPGEQWQLDGNAKDYLFSNENHDDFWLSGCRVEGSPGTNVANCRFFEVGTSTGDWDRAMFFNNYFYDGKTGSVGNDNNGWLIVLDNGVRTRKYVSMIGNTFDTANYSSNGFNTATIYNAEKWVVEHNIMKNMLGEAQFQFKDDCSNYSLRANDMWENNSQVYLRNQITDSPTIACENHEVCWNFLGHQIYWNAQGDPSEVGPFYAHRNTIYAPGQKAGIRIKGFASSPNEVAHVNKNFIVADDFPMHDSALDTAGSTDAAIATHWANGQFDNTFYAVTGQDALNTSTGKLQNAGLSVKGFYGAEIYNGV